MEHKIADFKTPCAKRMKNVRKTKKIGCVPKNNTIVKKRSSTKTTAAKPSTPKIKKSKKEQKTFLGLNLHRKFPCVAAVDQKGNLLMNERIENDFLR